MISNPITFDEASEKQEWRETMEEILAIEMNRTWDLVILVKREEGCRIEMGL